jgi:hypothetical protein
MKKRILIGFLAIMILLLVACTNKFTNDITNDISEIDNDVLSSHNSYDNINAENKANDLLSNDDVPPSSLGISFEYTTDENGYIWNYFDTLSVLFEENTNYKIYTDNAQISFYYSVFDDNGNLLDEGYHGWRGSFGFSFNEDGLLVLDYGLGGTPSMWQERYYDVSAGRVSRFFSNPVQTHGELIVYFTTKKAHDDIILIIQNIFDASVYYKEVSGAYSHYVWAMPCTAVFSDDSEWLSITYWTYPYGKEITDIIDLRQEQKAG